MTNEKEDGGTKEEEPGGPAQTETPKPAVKAKGIKWRYTGVSHYSNCSGEL